MNYTDEQIIEYLKSYNLDKEKTDIVSIKNINVFIK